MRVLSRRDIVSLAAITALVPRALLAAPAIATVAPDFTGVGSHGEKVGLGALQGKLVVLEWTNDGCPFVAKWYGAGAMQALQREVASLNGVWISVISSAPGEQGWADGPRANALTAARNAAPSHVILDPTGQIGRLYAAETTPQIYVIGADGRLSYMGGADSIASTRTEDLGRAIPHARNAITAIAAGKPAPVAISRPLRVHRQIRSIGTAGQPPAGAHGVSFGGARSCCCTGAGCGAVPVVCR